MDIEVVSDRVNALFGRREIAFSAVAESSTPSKAEMKKSLCSKLGLSPEATIIVEIGQEFGSKKCKCMAHSYKHKDDLRKNEPEYLLKRLDKAAGAAPAEEKKQEKEEKKDVAKKEDGK